MERYILAPDSFKGTLSAEEVCRILREEILRAKPGAEVLSIPVADGGEGSVDAFLTAAGGRRIFCALPWAPHGRGHGVLRAAAGRDGGGGDGGRGGASSGGRPAGAGYSHDLRRVGSCWRLRRIKAPAVLFWVWAEAVDDGGYSGRGAGGRISGPAKGEPLCRPAGIWTGLTGSTCGSSGLFRRLPSCCDIDNPLCGPAGASAVFSHKRGRDRSWWNGWTEICAIWRM